VNKGELGALVSAGAQKGDQLKRICAGAVYSGGPVEVRAGDTACGADFAYNCTGVDELAGVDRDRLEMGVEGVEPEAVVEDYGIAGKIERLG
jgi:hypothetical protein